MNVHVEPHFGTTSEEDALIFTILDRLEITGPERLHFFMCLSDCHTRTAPLNLERMSTWERLYDVTHDVYGIYRNLDRTTGELRNCFWPRFAKG